MRIIKRAALGEAANKHARARPTLEHWYRVAKRATWTKLTDTQATFPHADQVEVASGRITTVFNITNQYRLITAIHYNRQAIYILRFLSHAEYNKEEWKKTL